MTVEQEETMVEVKEKLKLIDICYKNNLIRSSDIREFIIMYNLKYQWKTRRLLKT